MASDDAGRPIPKAVEAYRKADGSTHSGSRGGSGANPRGGQVRLRHGTRRLFAEQVVELFDELAAPVRTAVADGGVLREPHTSPSGFGWEQLLQFGPPDDTVPTCRTSVTVDSFAGRRRAGGIQAIWRR